MSGSDDLVLTLQPGDTEPRFDALAFVDGRTVSSVQETLRASFTVS